MHAKNYMYGARPPVSNIDVIDAQMRLAHQYRNKLCELELARRAECEAILSRLAPAYVAARTAVEQCEANVEAIYDAINARSAAERKKVQPPPEQKKEIAEAKAVLKSMRAECREQKAAAYSAQDIQDALAAQKESHGAAKRAARAASGLYWGTYLVVEDACKGFGSGPPPRYLRWTGDGTVAVQLIGGLSVVDFLAGQDTRLQIADRPGFPGKPKHRVIRMRVGSDDHRAPIFADIPITYHRDLPSGSVIKWAYLHRTMVAGKARWAVRITAEAPCGVRATASSFCVIHVGWRAIDDQIRIAKWRGSDCKYGDLFLDADMVMRFQKPHDLQSIRDRRFNAMINRLCQWIDAAAAASKSMPDWLVEARKTMRLWKSQARLAGLVHRWSKDRFAGDDKVFARVEQWRKRDKHHWSWQANQSRSIRSRRDDLYRAFVADLASKYGRVCIMQADWAKMRRVPDPGEVDAQSTLLRRRSAIAAVATLERFAKESFGDDCLIQVDIAGITQTCTLCGVGNQIEGERYCTCVGCGVTYEVDDNGVANQFYRAYVASKTLPSLADVMRQRLVDDAAPKKLSVRQAAFVAARKSRSKKKGGK